jgi:ATP adenylyltransferase
VTGDFSLDEYLDLQKVVYRVAEALRQELPTERVYILSVGSQQGNRHVHWHVAPLPPGIPLEEQQFAALMPEKKGYLKIPEAEMAGLVKRLSDRISASVQQPATDN